MRPQDTGGAGWSEDSIVFDRAQVDRYTRTVTGRALTGDEAPPMALSLAVNRLAAAHHPSPPGSIHARQRFSLLAPVRVDVPTRARVRRAGDQVRNGRTYVVLEFEFEQQGAIVARAESQTLWAEGGTGASSPR